ncbi:ROK family transcriptional regulator [Cohnella sp. REN36]|uniref:ROK family transcriptional regulator n=1 Tax=Cohnella sp. REN36 TaxID=2887347 RepID=UPI001D15198D|nr:ROK family transcriptional regulator [Cohnella sp. REN36]MCC3373852.1 ROK family transcriptional regulator [Cohnella sp. REN36]
MSKRLNSIEIKKINRNNIYKYLYQRDPISVQDIAYSLKLSLPTVAQNLKELQEKELIVETGLFESTGGRKAKAIAYNSTARYAVGLDITRNHVGLVLIDLSGNVLNNSRRQFPFENSRDYFSGVGDLVKRFIEDCQVDTGKILGVGIALPAILSADKRTVSYATVIDFQGGTVELFSEFIPYPCTLSNDANAAGFAELWGRTDIQNVVYLSLNNSVGGSIILGKNIFAGENQRSGEFGHMTLFPNGRTCYCGQKGCVDAYCSAKVLSESTNGDIAEFFKQLKRRNPPQTQAWEEYLSSLVITINNLRMNFDCNVILGGYVGAYIEDYLDQLKALVALKNTFESKADYLQTCKYKLEATAVGAALQQVETFIDSI